jgi:uncharacterized protein
LTVAPVGSYTCGSTAGFLPAFFGPVIGRIETIANPEDARREREPRIAMDLHNETAVNVAAMLQEPVGSSRSYALRLDAFRLDDDLVAKDIDGTLRLTRLTDEIMASLDAAGAIELICQRCLEPFVQPVSVRFSEEFRIAYDVRTGQDLGRKPEEDSFEISAAHELDFGEVLRQEILIELPMRPSCGENCPGPPEIAAETNGDAVDGRLASLAALLEDDESNS